MPNKDQMGQHSSKPIPNDNRMVASNKPGEQFESHPKADSITPDSGPVGKVKEGRRKRERALGQIMEDM